MSQQESQVAEIRSLIEEYQKPEVRDIVDPNTGVKALFIVSKDGVSAIPASDFDDYRTAPDSRDGTATFTDIESLVDHVNRFKDADSAIFADDCTVHPNINVILDYHRQGHEGQPRFGIHRSAFRFPLSEEWQAWKEFDGSKFSMADFASFLEGRIIDVRDPTADGDLPADMQKFMTSVNGNIASPAKLMDLARGLKVNETSVVSEAVNLSSGEGKINFKSQHTDEAGAPLTVPNLFLIALPVFKNGPAYRLLARLRYRKTPEGLQFFYDLWRADRVFDHSFKESCERVRAETELPLFFGSPE